MFRCTIEILAEDEDDAVSILTEARKQLRKIVNEKDLTMLQMEQQFCSGAYRIQVHERGVVE